MIEIIEYTTEMGICPYRQYVINMKDKTAQSQLLKAITKMEAGLLKNTRSLDSGLQEYKIDVGEGHRIYFYRDGQMLIVLLAASTKADQDREIDRAKNYLTDYKRQKRTIKENDHAGNQQHYSRSA